MSMDWLAAPLILLLGLLSEILKLNFSKTTLSREAVFQREHKICLGGYVFIGLLLIYHLAVGKSTMTLLILVFWNIGIHIGAGIWNERR